MQMYRCLKAVGDHRSGERSVVSRSNNLIASRADALVHCPAENFQQDSANDSDSDNTALYEM